MLMNLLVNHIVDFSKEILPTSCVYIVLYYIRTHIYNIYINNYSYYKHVEQYEHANTHTLGILYNIYTHLTALEPHKSVHALYIL